MQSNSSSRSLQKFESNLATLTNNGQIFAYSTVISDALNSNKRIPGKKKKNKLKLDPS